MQVDEGGNSKRRTAESVREVPAAGMFFGRRGRTLNEKSGNCGNHKRVERMARQRLTGVAGRGPRSTLGMKLSKRRSPLRRSPSRVGGRQSTTAFIVELTEWRGRGQTGRTVGESFNNRLRNTSIARVGRSQHRASAQFSRIQKVGASVKILMAPNRRQQGRARGRTSTQRGQPRQTRVVLGPWRQSTRSLRASLWCGEGVSTREV